ncbi:hypothetical protein BT93_G0192 [Corymbia citriodora subsp. variegata]|nr:hypothetical protein BT93_G0192 [Corymbia citriodora subsp. variegata]
MADAGGGKERADVGLTLAGGSEAQKREFLFFSFLVQDPRRRRVARPDRLPRGRNPGGSRVLSRDDGEAGACPRPELGGVRVCQRGNRLLPRGERLNSQISPVLEKALLDLCKRAESGLDLDEGDHGPRLLLQPRSTLRRQGVPRQHYRARSGERRDR